MNKKKRERKIREKEKEFIVQSTIRFEGKRGEKRCNRQRNDGGSNSSSRLGGPSHLIGHSSVRYYPSCVCVSVHVPSYTLLRTYASRFIRSLDQFVSFDTIYIYIYTLVFVIFYIRSYFDDFSIPRIKIWTNENRLLNR